MARKAPDLAVWTDDRGDSDSEKLAARLGLPWLVSEEPPERDFLLFFDDDALYLFPAGREGYRPFSVDYLGGDFARRWRSATKNDILVKAIGLKKGVATVCDATCGLGYDAFLLATFKGLEVTTCERSPVVAELVLDALSRVKDTGLLEARPLYFHFGDGAEFLKARAFDAVYLDPMFPREEGDSALPKKEMQVVAELVGDDPDSEKLFDAAWQAAKMRVVVKRADKAPGITAKREPDFSLNGKTVRYDVYLKTPGGAE